MIPSAVQEILDHNGLKALEFDPGSTPTSQMAADRIGVQVAQIAKSILLAGKDGCFRMAVLPGDRKLASGKFKTITGVKHRMATPEETLEQTGFRIGGVCPFGVNGLQIFIDQRLGNYQLIYPAAGTDASGVPMHLDDLARITRGQVCDIAQDG
ncbi:YbaK/EbsC family protein [Desulfovermiculus halophilus]|jgi:prolyl-tRNA editing enzyme YbaK/EbsC (Cys-tRNA(Pro) deacylase)|uniref:YbaK/EbsC family protein n=1 Tax=Desulfovermiculus halophilus TaxID=339722 RepID=UPI0004862241|nr:YbaK/EbsC family protein [Desulfovermiculus halophilus]